MKRISVVLGLMISFGLHAGTVQSFRDNEDISIMLSDTNYNRLVVREDKIIQAYFPESAMGVKNESDGSLYLISTQKEPFTLFLSTEHGHHFSATVNTESSFGKTIELVPKTLSIAKKQVTSISTSKPVDAAAVEMLMSHLVKKAAMKGFNIKHHYGRAIRLKQGLVLLPRLTYVGRGISGEVTEIYNGGRLSLDLDESLFMSTGVKAVSLSQRTLPPKQKAYVYRILGIHHG